MKLCMIGTGYVGLVSGTCFADIGNQVVCVDKDFNKIKKLNSGISPIYEPGLNELIKKNFLANRLTFTTDLKKAINKSDLIFICVGTPTKKNSLKVDLSFEGTALIDLTELGRIILVKVSFCIKIPKSPNWLWIIENSKFLIFDKILLKQGQAFGCI